MAEEKKDSQFKPMILDDTESKSTISLTVFHHSGIEPTRADVSRNPLPANHWSNGALRSEIGTSLFIQQCLNDPTISNLADQLIDQGLFNICKRYTASTSDASYRRMDVQSPIISNNVIYFNDATKPMGTLYVIHICCNSPLCFSPLLSTAIIYIIDYIYATQHLQPPKFMIVHEEEQ